MTPPSRATTRALASRTWWGLALPGNLNGPSAATRRRRECDRASPSLAAATPPACASNSISTIAGTTGSSGKCPWNTSRPDARAGSHVPTRRARDRRPLRPAASEDDAGACRPRIDLQSWAVSAILTAVSTSEVSERFRALCRDQPRTLAVRSLSDGRTATFADLLDDVTESSRALADLGVSRGSNVVSFVGNHPLFLSLIVACLEGGQALLPLGDATDAEVAGLVAQSGAAAIVTDRIPPVAAVDVRELRIRHPGRAASRLVAASVLRRVGRSQAHVGFDRPAEGRDRVRNAPHQRRPPHHRRHGHQAGRRQPRVHSACHIRTRSATS